MVSGVEIPSAEQYKKAAQEKDIYELDRRTSIIRKYYWYYKNYYIQRSIYTQIESYRKMLGIGTFVGVFSP